MPPPISAGSGWRKRNQQKYEDQKYEDQKYEDIEEDEDIDDLEEDIEYGLKLPATVMPKHPSGG